MTKKIFIDQSMLMLVGTKEQMSFGEMGTMSVDEIVVYLLGVVEENAKVGTSLVFTDGMHNYVAVTRWYLLDANDYDVMVEFYQMD